MAATASLKDIEQIRQKQKEERERKRLEMIETQKQIEEMKKNEVYNQTLNNNQQQRPNVNNNRYFEHNDDHKTDTIMEHKVMNGKQNGALNDNNNTIKKRKPKK